MIQSPYFYSLPAPRHWLLRDASEHSRVRFHVRENDYFSTLASVLRFYEEYIRDAVSTDSRMRELELKVIHDIIEDLLYLDRHYVISPKSTAETSSAPIP